MKSHNILLVVLIIIVVVCIITCTCIHNEKFSALFNTSRDLREKYFKKAIKLFNENDIEYYVGYGTLLGIIREGRLLKNDDDIDIMVHTDDYDKARNLLQKNGILLIHGKNFSHGLIVQGRVEIYRYIIENDTVVDLWAPKAKYEHVQYVSDVYPLKKKNVLGINVNIPQFPEKVLERIYSNWKFPSSGKGHK